MLATLTDLKRAMQQTSCHWMFTFVGLFPDTPPQIVLFNTGNQIIYQCCAFIKPGVITESSLSCYTAVKINENILDSSSNRSVGIASSPLQWLKLKQQTKSVYGQLHDYVASKIQHFLTRQQTSDEFLNGLQHSRWRNMLMIYDSITQLTMN